jgi:MoaE-MoaD fusion protein
MRVKVLFFGMLKDLTGQSEASIDLAPSSTIATVFTYFAADFPKLHTYAPSIVMARNQEFAPLTTPIHEGDEIAFLPPVSGGSNGGPHLELTDDAGNYFALTRHPIDSRALSARITQPSDGAVVIFEGIVRDNTKGRATSFLDYECYEAMALKLMASIGREIAQAHSISRIAFMHRLGRMQIGEASVVIVATAPHRRPAFDAALEGINRLKKTVPIWKKEHFADGEVWVEGEWDEKVPVASPR